MEQHWHTRDLRTSTSKRCGSSAGTPETDTKPSKQRPLEATGRGKPPPVTQQSCGENGHLPFGTHSAPHFLECCRRGCTFVLCSPSFAMNLRVLRSGSLCNESQGVNTHKKKTNSVMQVDAIHWHRKVRKKGARNECRH